MYCPNCGIKNNRGSNNCSKCGYPMPKNDNKIVFGIFSPIDCLIIIVAVIIIISGFAKGDENYTIKNLFGSNQEINYTQDYDDYDLGRYLIVGEDIDPGLYKVVSTSDEYAAYVARLNTTNIKNKDDYIIANELLYGDYYVEIKSTDKMVEVSFAKLTPIDEVEIEIKKEIGEGIYIVGKDILPGKYKVELNPRYEDWDYYYINYLSDVSMDYDKIIEYIDVEKGEIVEIPKDVYAIKFDNLVLTYVE